nr:hypothetical protein [Clostridium botulinum]
MNKTNIKCSRCHSDKLYKFDLNKQAKQNYLQVLNGEKYYLWLAINSETRFILTFHLNKSLSSDSAYTLINEAKNCGEPAYFIIYRLP